MAGGGKLSTLPRYRNTDAFLDLRGTNLANEWIEKLIMSTPAEGFVGRDGIVPRRPKKIAAFTGGGLMLEHVATTSGTPVFTYPDGTTTPKPSRSIVYATGAGGALRGMTPQSDHDIESSSHTHGGEVTADTVTITVPRGDDSVEGSWPGWSMFAYLFDLLDGTATLEGATVDWTQGATGGGDGGDSTVLIEDPATNTVLSATIAGGAADATPKSPGVTISGDLLAHWWSSPAGARPGQGSLGGAEDDGGGGTQALDARGAAGGQPVWPLSESDFVTATILEEPFGAGGDSEGSQANNRDPGAGIIFILHDGGIVI